MHKERILVVDDEPKVVQFCSRALAQQGYRVHEATSGQLALARLEAEPFDLLLVDVRMPDVDGLTVLRRGRELDPDLTAVVITGYATLESAIQALHAGAQGFLLKPFGLRELAAAVKDALAQRQKEQERQRLQAQLPILEIGQALMAKGDVEDLSGRLLEAIVRQIGADQAALLLLADDTGELYIAGAIGLPAQVTIGTRVPVEQSISGWVLRQNEPLVLDERSRANLDPSWQALLNRPEIASAVCLPLRAKGKTIGVLNLGRLASSAPFTSGDMDLLLIIGRQVSMALENARLYEQIQARSRFLETLQRRFRLLFEEAPLSYQALDQDGNVMEVNKAWLALLGYSREEVVGRWFGAFLPPEQQERFRDSFAHFLVEGEIHGQVYEIVRRDGTRIIASFDGTIGHDERGNFRQMHCTLQDITEQVQAQEAVRQERDRAQQYLDIAGVILVALDEKGEITLLNRKGHTILGYGEGELVGKNWFATCLPADARKEAKRVYQHLIAGEIEPGEYYENPVVTRNGEERMIAWHNTVFKDEKGNIVGTLSSGEDITEQKQAEAASRRRVTQLVLINEIGRKIAAEFELDGVLDAAARLVQKNFGYHQVAVFAVDGERKEAVMKARAGAYVTSFPADYRLKLSEGMVGWVACHGEKLLANDVDAEPRYINAHPEPIPTQSELSVPIRIGKVTVGVLDAQSPKLGAFDENDVLVMETVAGQIAVAIEDARLYEAIQRELTERKRAEEALRLERDLAVALGSTSDLTEALNRILATLLQFEGVDCGGVYLVDATSGELNLVVHRGLDAAFVASASHFAADAPQTRLVMHGRPLYQHYSQVLPGTDHQVRERAGLRATAIVPVSYKGEVIAALNMASHTLDLFTDNIRNVLEAITSQIGGFIARVAAEEALRESEVRFRSTFEQAAVGIAHVAPDGHFVRINQRFCDIVGYSQQEMLARGFQDITHPDDLNTDLEHARRVLAGELQTYSLEKRYLRKDGSVVWINLTVALVREPWGDPKYFISVVEDISSRRQAEQMLLQSEKLAAMGKLAASMAHEINNPLQSVQGCLTLAEEELAAGLRREKMKRYLGIAVSEIERIAEIVRRVRDFYRAPVTGMQPTDVHAVLESVLELSGKQLQHSNVTVERTWASDLPVIQANPDHLKQVFLNLVLNAIDAMPQGGILGLRTVRHHMPAPGDQPLQPAVYIEFSDTGKGMPPGTQARLFEPFFTTKEHGSGLGLYISHAIVAAHHGQITVTSYEGLGSTFSILLPVDQP